MQCHKALPSNQLLTSDVKKIVSTILYIIIMTCFSFKTRLCYMHNMYSGKGVILELDGHTSWYNRIQKHYTTIDTHMLLECKWRRQNKNELKWNKSFGLRARGLGGLRNGHAVSVKEGLRFCSLEVANPIHTSWREGTRSKVEMRIIACVCGMVLASFPVSSTNFFLHDCRKNVFFFPTCKKKSKQWRLGTRLLWCVCVCRVHVWLVAIPFVWCVPEGMWILMCGFSRNCCALMSNSSCPLVT